MKKATISYTLGFVAGNTHNTRKHTNGDKSHHGLGKAIGGDGEVSVGGI